MFIKLKPTIIYVLFGGVLLGGLAFGKPLLGMVFDSVFHLTEEGWRKLTLRWALFFFALAVLNEIVWRTQTDRYLGQLQGVRRAAADVSVRRVAVSAADEICRAGGEGGAASRRLTMAARAASAFSIAGFNPLSRLSGVIGPISL